MHKNGRITLEKITNWNLRTPKEKFAKVSTIRSAVRHFMFGLEDVSYTEVIMVYILFFQEILYLHKIINASFESEVLYGSF